MKNEEDKAAIKKLSDKWEAEAVGLKDKLDTLNAAAKLLPKNKIDSNLFELYAEYFRLQQCIFEIRDLIFPHPERSKDE